MNARERYNLWLNSSTIDDATRWELFSIRNDDNEINERFYKGLEFGTAGLRGIIGAGDNRMNRYNVIKASLGLASYLNSIHTGDKSVVIAYDSRYMSYDFALAAAHALAQEGIKSYVFSVLHSVPQLSFAIRYLKCIAGIVITASHNPPKYNGYKVYWSHGGQVAPKEANEITDCINKVGDLPALEANFNDLVEKGLITFIPKENEVDTAYYNATQSLLLYPDLLKQGGKDIKLVYTPLHGSGNIPVRTILNRIGLSNVLVVKAQEEPDFTFPTVSAPNPENPEAFELAIELANSSGATVILATDPDSDRLGVAVKKSNGQWAVLSGNQIAAILLHSRLTGLKQSGRLPNNGLVVKSLVSTRLADAICGAFDVELCEVLTGFRFISEKIDYCQTSGDKTFIFGFEESYGFLAGGFARDKDAICAAMLIAEACVLYAQNNMTLYDALQQIYHTYGYYKEMVKSYTLEGMAGIEKINNAMVALRSNPKSTVADIEVSEVEDYLNTHKTGLPKSNVLRYSLSNGAWIAVRPSGTEPKLKLYIGANAKDEIGVDELLSSMMADMDSTLSELLK